MFLKPRAILDLSPFDEQLQDGYDLENTISGTSIAKVDLCMDILWKRAVSTSPGGVK
jgi:hypothetical protein